MGRESKEIKEFRINKGRGACKAVYNGYWGVVKLRDILWKIYLNHKTWGADWYHCVRDENYGEAVALLEVVAKRHDGANEAIDIINLIIDIEMEA
jgi:hypothetical protein